MLPVMAKITSAGIPSWQMAGYVALKCSGAMLSAGALALLTTICITSSAHSRVRSLLSIWGMLFRMAWAMGLTDKLYKSPGANALRGKTILPP